MYLSSARITNSLAEIIDWHLEHWGRYDVVDVPLTNDLEETKHVDSIRFQPGGTRPPPERYCSTSLLDANLFTSDLFAFAPSGDKIGEYFLRSTSNCEFNEEEFRICSFDRCCWRTAAAAAMVNVRAARGESDLICVQWCSRRGWLTKKRECSQIMMLEKWTIARSREEMKPFRSINDKTKQVGKGEKERRVICLIEFDSWQFETHDNALLLVLFFLTDRSICRFSS